MKKRRTTANDLAALHALGALDGEDARLFAKQLHDSAQARAEADGFGRVAELLAKSLRGPVPSSNLKDSILRRAAQAKAQAGATAQLKTLLPQAQDGLAFLRGAGEANWLPLPVSGAFVKLLSFDDASGYAVVLGKLEAGSRYPSHTHLHPEDIYMLSGDLHVGEEIIRSGDFHHAEAGSVHGVNWSEQGCVLICVLSKEDLLAQVVPA